MLTFLSNDVPQPVRTGAYLNFHRLVLALFFGHIEEAWLTAFKDILKTDENPPRRLDDVVGSKQQCLLWCVCVCVWSTICGISMDAIWDSPPFICVFTHSFSLRNTNGLFAILPLIF